MPQEAYFQVGQKAFIERDGELLVMFFEGQKVDFPGGRIQEGEDDLEAALKREVREETSLEISVGAPFTTWLAGRHGGVYIVGYRCTYVSGEVILSEEHNGYRWVNRDTYRELDDGSRPFAELCRSFDA
jgi:8-oxo-dGTP diphosphatase